MMTLQLQMDNLRHALGYELGIYQFDPCPTSICAYISLTIHL